MSSILVSRFLLNLRQANEPGTLAETAGQMSSLQFAFPPDGIGGMQEPLALSDGQEEGGDIDA